MIQHRKKPGENFLKNILEKFRKNSWKKNPKKMKVTLKKETKWKLARPEVSHAWQSEQSQ